MKRNFKVFLVLALALVCAFQFVGINAVTASADDGGYIVKLKDMLDNNIKAENIAIESYKLAITRVKNQSLKDLFMRIIEDEMRHVEIFKRIRDNVQFMSI